MVEQTDGAKTAHVKVEWFFQLDQGQIVGNAQELRRVLVGDKHGVGVDGDASDLSETSASIAGGIGLGKARDADRHEDMIDGCRLTDVVVPIYMEAYTFSRQTDHKINYVC